MFKLAVANEPAIVGAPTALRITRLTSVLPRANDSPPCTKAKTNTATGLWDSSANRHQPTRSAVPPNDTTLLACRSPYLPAVQTPPQSAESEQRKHYRHHRCLQFRSFGDDGSQVSERTEGGTVDENAENEDPLH